MASTSTFVVARRDRLQSSHENVTADILLSLWKQSFLEPSTVLHGDPVSVAKVQAALGRRREFQSSKAEIYARKHTAVRNVQEKGLQKCRHQEDKVHENEKKLQKSKVAPSYYIALLKTCAKQKDLHRGAELHAHIVNTSLFKESISIFTNLVSMYSKCGAFQTAQDVFNEIWVRNVVAWNALVDGYIQHGHAWLAIISFQHMLQECVFPNSVTYVYILKACGSLGDSNKGRAVHAQLLRNRSLEIDNVIGTALIDMYAKCQLLREAEAVFAKLVTRDVVSWNALISSYTHHRHGEQAIECFQRMQHEGHSPNVVTFIVILKACGSIKALVKGQALHAYILREGFLTKEHVSNVLVAMYAKCGVLAKAQEVFDGLHIKDVVSWSALITGYALQFRPEEALSCFNQMQQEGLSPNAITFLCALRACSSMGVAHRGQEMHAKIVKEGWMRKDIRVANALVDMYVKCGALSKAQEVFDELPAKSIVLWTALISGYAQAGKEDVAFKLYNNMIREGNEPDLVTYTNLLNACSNGGLLDKGQMYIEVLKELGMFPTLEHYTRMVDLFARAGNLQNAAILIDKMPFLADLVMWHSLLGACQKWGNVEFGRWAFNHAVQLNEEDASAYVIMSNIYEAAQYHETEKSSPDLCYNGYISSKTMI